MKAIITILVLAGLVLGGVWMFGGYRDFDPNKQGEEARKAIKPGMTLAQVVKVAGKNPRLQIINRFEQKIGKEKVSELRPGTPVDFEFEKMQRGIRDKQYPNGFVLNYKYSERTAFAVTFDETGAVTELNDVTTMADLLHTR